MCFDGIQAGPLDSCALQNACLTFTVTPSTTNCGGDCHYKVCAVIDSSLPGCTKKGQDTWSHTCKKSSAANGECEIENGFANPGAVENKTIKTGYFECQIIKGGDKVEFLFKDGNGCDNSAIVSVAGGGIIGNCAPRTLGTKSCTGNGVGKECIFTIPTPQCTGVEPNNVSIQAQKRR